MHAQRCPVCYGKGVIHDDAYPSMADTKTCHGCGGSGWVCVPDERPHIPLDDLEKHKEP